MAYDVISEIGFGAPFGFVKSGSDIGGLIQAFHDGLPLFGVLSRIYPFTNWIKKTWLGEKYFIMTPEHQGGFGTMMRFRDKLIDERIDDTKAGKADGRVDLLQTYAQSPSPVPWPFFAEPNPLTLSLFLASFLSTRTEDGTPLPLDYVKGIY